MRPLQKGFDRFSPHHFNVVLVLEHYAQGVVDYLRVQLGLVQGQQRRGPVNSLGYPWDFVELGLPQFLNKSGDLLCQLAGGVRQLGADYLQFLLEVGVVDPVVQAASLQGVVNFPGPVGGDNYDGWMGRTIGAQLGYGYLEIGQQLQQESLEFFIGAIQLVDQQHRRLRPAFVDGLQQRTLDQKTLAEQVVGYRLAVDGSPGFHQADFQHLPRVVPFVDRVVDVQTFIALQPNQFGVQAAGQRPGNFRLADAGFSFYEKGPLQLEGQEDSHGQSSVRNVLLLAQ